MARHQPRVWGLRACARGMLAVIVVDPVFPLHIEWEKGGNSALGDKSIVETAPPPQG